MTRPSTTRRSARKAPGRKASKPKRANSAKGKRGKQDSASDLREQLERCTAELAEARAQQTATADVLKVISRSAFDLDTVLRTLVTSALELCDGGFGLIRLRDGDLLEFGIGVGMSPSFEEYVKNNSQPIGRDSASGRAALTREVVHLADVLADPTYRSIEEQRVGGYRTLLTVPLLRDNQVIGAFSLARPEVKPFSERQIELVKTYADQAVIAIQNVRLFNELQARTRDLQESLQQQTATSEVLQIISTSPGDLAPVFDKMLENAVRVCGAEFGSMLLLEDGLVRQVARYNAPPALVAARGDGAYPPPPRSVLATAIESKNVAQTADLRTRPTYLNGAKNDVDLVELGGARTVAVVPMLRDDEVIGTITIYRQEVRLFEDKQIELVRNFAKQAVIAIENARLLRELRQRTADLSKSLDELRTAQDRLIQTEKLASLGQLTAGIAHEIKNPLNFVNNFAALSTELIDEMNDALADAGLNEKKRDELNELTQTLKSNLEKVVQHGKRADSIVKNMLLHSREGSGERSIINVNAMVDEALNLAYHGARAEKRGFNVTIEKRLDPAAGEAELYLQEITRVLLNLISNGFYATAKRAQAEGGDYEPTLSVSTRDLGHSVELAIRDNGTGIPDDVKAKMFNPFFTTKPAGEGTGLGLSLSHDIVVKQHGGTIEVATEPGRFTAFTITLPREGTSS